MSVQLSLPVGVVIFLSVALAAYYFVSLQAQGVASQMEKESKGFAETLKRVTFLSMLTDERGHLYRIISQAAGRSDIDRIRIFNADGRISYSTDPAEVGREVDKKAEACYGCHTRSAPLTRLPSEHTTRIFRDAQGNRILGTILPIYNEKGCSGPPCHAHGPERRVLGVLDVNMSLAATDQALSRELWVTIAFAVLLFLGASTMVGLGIILTVNRAVKGLSREVDKVAGGDLYSVSRVEAPAELGRLADSINYMAQRVARRAERQNRRYRQFVDDSPDAVLVLDQEGRVILANPEAGRLLGRPPEEILKTHLHELVVKEDRSDLLRSVQEALGPHRLCSLIRLRVGGEGDRTRILQGRFRGIDLEDGLPGLIGNFSDITDRSAMEAQLVKQTSLAAVGRTVGGLVPYIRNLLHGLKNASYIVDQGLETGDQELSRQGWNMVQRSVDRVSSVSDDLLYYADYRIERPQILDFNQVMNEVKQLAAERAAQAGAEILTTPDAACRKVSLDHAGMRKAILNLANNSLDALAASLPAPEGRRVEISCGRNETGRIVITVADNGPGMDEATLAQIFGGLFSTKGAKGTGMGLLICQKIIEEHGGFMDVWSKPGKGTRVTILVPDLSPMAGPADQ